MDLPAIETDTICFSNNSVVNCVYGIHDYIARGAFGIVHKGRATLCTQNASSPCVDIAVKSVHMDDRVQLQTDSEHFMKMRRRFTTLLGLKNAHVATYHEIKITKTEGGPLVEIVMDYYGGGDLSEHLSRLQDEGSLLEEPSALRYASEIASGLSYLHCNRIFHGDLKPGNLFMKTGDDISWTVVIGDLDDLVQIQRSVTQARDITHHRGTTRFMSPETIKRLARARGVNRPAGRKSDVWSVGCIMLELGFFVTGQHERYLSRKMGETVDCSTINDNRFMELITKGYIPYVPPSTPLNLAGCIQLCLCRDAQDRTDAEELARRLPKKSENPAITANDFEQQPEIINLLGGPESSDTLYTTTNSTTHDGPSSEEKREVSSETAGSPGSADTAPIGQVVYLNAQAPVVAERATPNISADQLLKQLHQKDGKFPVESIILFCANKTISKGASLICLKVFNPVDYSVTKLEMPLKLANKTFSLEFVAWNGSVICQYQNENRLRFNTVAWDVAKGTQTVHGFAKQDIRFKCPVELNGG
ncbi:mitogen-activated protein kinase kinase kinase 19-like [Paramacrobiotus metropolitanus]|uniref:mitogen-activated protein kinase kinase kinase 19-like n=1 Tax=Paramacrobiotus metropolitanus TaxID=2943436 RepID=UPI0024455F00|nr:mitogen-activated protein kinase kinase kinase 19-like [Paramacrobiotus metropolitanus]